MLTLLIGAALAFVGSAIGRLWFTRLELVQEKRKYLYEQVLPDLRPQISPPMIVIQRFDELRRLGDSLQGRSAGLSMSSWRNTSHSANGSPS